MKQDFNCEICGDSIVIGRGHGYEFGKIIANHMRVYHPTDYNKIAKTQEKIDAIEEKYKIYARDFFYFKKEK